MLVSIGGIELWQGSTWAEDGDPSEVDDTWAGWQAADYNWSEESPESTWGGLAPVWENDDPTIWSDVWGINNRLVEYKNFSVHTKIGERSTARMVIKDLLELYLFEQFQEVIIRDNDMNIYYGGLVSAAETKQLSQVVPGLEHSIETGDYQTLAEKRRFNQAFVTPTPREMFMAILGVLSEEGITEGEIQDGPALPDQLFSNMTCAAASTKAAQLAGVEWWISEDKKYYAVVRTAYRAAWDIEDGTDVRVEGLSLRNGNPDYRNRQIYTGAKSLTKYLEEYIQGDGVRKSWPIGYPLAQVPIITDENGDPCLVGIKGLDTGKEFYWSKDDFIITMDQEADPLPNGALRLVKYYGSFPIAVKVDQVAEIARNKLAEGSGFSGIIEDVIVDTSIQNQDAAVSAAEATLATYASQGKQLRYSTVRRDLACGVIQEVTLPKFKLDASEFLIYSIDIIMKPGPNGAERLYHQVSACQGPVDPSWSKVICHIAELGKAQAQQAISESDSIQGLTTFEHTWQSFDAPNPFIAATEDYLINDENFPCLAWEDVFPYVVVYVTGVEYFRKPIASITEDLAGTKIITIALLLTQECNGVAISHIGLWGGCNATSLAGTGVEMIKYAFSKTKTILESLEFIFVDSYINSEEKTLSYYDNWTLIQMDELTLSELE